MIKTDGFNDAINWLYLLIHFVIAFLAGSMKELNRVASNRFIFRNLISQCAVSSFVGVITFLVLDWLGLDFRLCAAITGVADWLGSSFMDFMSLVIKKRISKMMDVNITQEEERSHSKLINK